MKVSTRRKDFLSTPAYGGSFGKSKRFKHCCYCEKQMTLQECTREHLLPKSKGGRIIKPCCLECNQEKADRLPIDWVIYLYDIYFKRLKEKKMQRAHIRLRNAINYLVALYPGEYDFIFK